MDKKRDDEVDEPLAMPLWPDTGRLLGLGKNRTYDSARAGEIPTVPFGRVLRVTMWFYRQLREGPGPRPQEGNRSGGEVAR
jgi:hypothetical protein